MMGFRNEKKSLLHFAGQYADAVVRDMSVLHLIWSHFWPHVQDRVERDLTGWFPDREWPGSQGKCILAQIVLQRASLPAVCPTHSSKFLCPCNAAPGHDPTCSRERGPQEICSSGKIRCGYRLAYLLGNLPLQTELQQPSFLRLTF